jgi:hypothetical protein
MSVTSAGHPHQAGQYEIRLKGHLASRWATWFAPMTLTADSDGTTVLVGPVVDQAALHGLLHKVRDLGLPLLSVIQLDVIPLDVIPVDVIQLDADPDNSNPGE